MPEDIVKKHNLQRYERLERAQMKTIADMYRMFEGAGEGPSKFRQLVPDKELGTRGFPVYDENVPRIVLNKADWPYEVDES